MIATARAGSAARGRLTAADVAQTVFEAVRDERFYILTHPKIMGAVQARMEDILSGARKKTRR